MDNYRLVERTFINGTYIYVIQKREGTGVMHTWVDDGIFEWRSDAVEAIQHRMGLDIAGEEVIEWKTY